MTLTLVTIAVIFIVPFLFTVFIGAPYVPTFTRDIKKAFRRMDVRSGMTVVDLGSGDGRILLLASSKGAEAVGYELNPWLWLISWVRTAAVRDSVTVHFKNYLKADLSSADVVFVFTSAIHKNKLEAKLQRELSSNAVIVSNGFSFDGLKKVDTVGSLIVYKRSNHA